MKDIRNSIKDKDYLAIWFLFLFLVGLSIVLFTNTRYWGHQQFSFLADSFLKGKLFFTDLSVVGTNDTSLFNGHYYWPLGFFPAILMVPFVLVFGRDVPQALVSISLVVGTIFLLYKIAKSFVKTSSLALFLSFSYIFSTAYIMVAILPVSWYFAHVVATFFIVLAIYFTIIINRPVLAGIFFSFAFLTRLSVAFSFSFFVLFPYLFIKEKKINKIVEFLIPVLFGIVLFFLYNYFRFGNIMESGYRYQDTLFELEVNRSVGMWSIKHFPANIYLLFFKVPRIIFYPHSYVIRKIVTDPVGMSFLYTSPILLYLFKADLKNKLNQISLFATLSTAVFLFGSFGLGCFQYGYRFALDFQPFLYIVLCSVFQNRKFGLTPYILSTLSFLVNLYFVHTHFGYAF